MMNDSKVLPARIYGTKESTGAKVEFLLTKRIEGDLWETMVRPGKRLKPGDRVSFADDGSFSAVIEGYGEGGTRHAGSCMKVFFWRGLKSLDRCLCRRISKDRKMMKIRICIRRSTAERKVQLRLLQRPAFYRGTSGCCKGNGVKTVWVTLHVGIGTFRPVKVENIEEHHMHFEEYSVSDETAAKINETKAEGEGSSVWVPHP